MHFTEEKQLNFYTSQLSISQKKLNLVLRNSTGLTPAKFLETYILNEAARILRYSDLSVKQIVAELGYSDSSYFIKAFKKQFKKTPLEYRKSAELDLNTT
nr:helix-turn-helix domain-containing protein [Arenibacter sp. N53]